METVTTLEKIIIKVELAKEFARVLKNHDEFNRVDENFRNVYEHFEYFASLHLDNNFQMYQKFKNLPEEEQEQLKAMTAVALMMENGCLE